MHRPEDCKVSVCFTTTKCWAGETCDFINKETYLHATEGYKNLRVSKCLFVKAPSLIAYMCYFVCLKNYIAITTQVTRLTLMRLLSAASKLHAQSEVEIFVTIAYCTLISLGVGVDGSVLNWNL